MPTEVENVFIEIETVLGEIKTVVEHAEFAAAVGLVKNIPGLQDVWTLITDGLKAVFAELKKALDGIIAALNDPAGIGKVTEFADSASKLLALIAGMITGTAATTMEQITSSIDMIKGIAGDIVTTIENIKMTTIAIESAL